MRCTRCILPDSIPGISFDEKGVCNFCNDNFPNYNPKGDDFLQKILREGLRENSGADCLVGLSGGKDSTYTLLKLKEQFGMRVEAFTYIHEGTTGFSLENAKKVCNQFSIKHHIVSLKNEAHLKTFHGYFKAFSKSPSSTTAGMTCVACKNLHILGYDIAAERNIPFIVWSTSPLEYSPFLALKYNGGEKEQFKREGNVKGAYLLLKEMVNSFDFPKTFLTNLKTSLNGCLAAFPTSGYLLKKYPDISPLFFYEYHNWVPDDIIEYITQNSDWRVPEEIDDWHSDCLFNFFKEYMFLHLYKASYTDAFLSNQIRYGLISREEAIIKLNKNKKQNKEGIFRAIESLGLNDLQKRIDSTVFTEY
ncbi:MAG: hypothetical protein SCALA702_04470 [Melioribacteraceae bacterium]|nr:MAG: hypothetical protein SCALA702_04470 [Melioribacteraceae bacterium]